MLGGGEHEPVTADDEWDDFPSEDECEPVAGEEVLTLQNLDLQAAARSDMDELMQLDSTETLAGPGDAQASSGDAEVRYCGMARGDCTFDKKQIEIDRRANYI